MVIDSSALVAVLLQEPDTHAIAAALSAERRRVIGAPTLLEASMVVESRLGIEGVGAAAALVIALRVRVAAFDASTVRLAIVAWRRFGKGNHPAALNLGDCLTYAIARQAGEPLLCLGNDFVQTDLEVVTLAA